MKRLIIYLFIITLGISFSGCPETFETDIRIYNESDGNIFCLVSADDPRLDCSDTLLVKEKYGVNIQQKSYYSWSFWFKDACNTIRIFILDPDTVAAYPWAKIREENKIIKRYDIPKSDLQKMNWKITYP